MLKLKAISEKVSQLVVETCTSPKKLAAIRPKIPPASEIITDASKNVRKMLKRLKPKERRVPISLVRLATAAYIVIIAPTIAPKLKTMLNTVPRSEERRVGKECRSRWSP